MSASPLHYQKRTPGSVSVISPLLRHVNTGALAFLLFVALALLSPMRGKELESKESAPAKARAGDGNVLFPGPVGPGQSDYRFELRQGYLEVYSATDEFDDGGVPYHAHSSYAIYTSDGKLLRNVENHISRSDEIPEVVALPIGFYMVDVQSEQNGYVRVPVVIKTGRRTILHLDRREKETLSQLAHR